VSFSAIFVALIMDFRMTAQRNATLKIPTVRTSRGTDSRVGIPGILCACFRSLGPMTPKLNTKVASRPYRWLTSSSNHRCDMVTPSRPTPLIMKGIRTQRKREEKAYYVDARGEANN